MSLAVLADHMASKGRGPDSMLIHMSPREVQGLQALAMRHGGSLTINPDTGLPEAGFLDKLLPAIIGFALGPAGFALATPMQAAMVVGGIQAARTGDIGKGISAGLGAYGGAGLSGATATAGASQMAGEALVPAAMEQAALEGITLPSNYAEMAARTVTPEQIAAAQQTASPMDLISKGATRVGANPMDFATKDNLKYLSAAAGPAIMAGMNVQAKGPQTVTKPGMIRPYSFDPYGGTYTAGTPYEAAPAKAAEGGLMGMAQGGAFDFVQRSEPVLRMADGGVAGYAVGGAPQMLSDEQLYQKTGSWEAAAAARDEQNRAANIYADAQKLAAATAPVTTATPAYFTANPDVAKAFTENSYGMTPEAFAQTHYEKYGQAEGRALPSAAASYAAANNIDLAGNINQWVADNPFATAAQVSSEAQKYGVSDTDIQRALAANTNISDAARYALTHNMGLAGLQQGVLNALKANPNATQAQIDAAQAQYGLSNADIQSPFAHGYQIANEETAAASKYLQDNKDVARWISSAEGQDYVRAHPEFDAADIAWTHYQRYGKDEGRKWGLDKKIDTVLDTGIDTGAITSVVPGGFYGNATNPGDITTNADGTVTVHPNIPGRPVGGFPGMASVRDVYTAGGGNLGYTPFVPKTIEEFESRYNKLTGGSKQAYDYLTGKTPYSPTPYTPTGEVMKPYAESVLGMPVNKSKRMYIFDPATKTYKINPDYAIPTYDKDGNKTYNLTNKDVITYMATKPAPADFYNWAKTNNLTVEQIAAATGMPITEVQKMLTGGTPKDTATSTGSIDTTQGGGGGGDGLAAGGLSAINMARGGQYDLGDYSDGGRLLRGPGDGVSDSIPASIGNKRPARLADGEFVVPARIVSELGNGSTEAGARKLYAMMDRIQAARRGTVGKGRVAKNSRADKHLPA